MKKTSTIFPEVWIIEPDVFQDDRGFFLESYSFKKYKEMGFSWNFIQDNHSKSKKNTVRGLHFQTFPGQVKLVRCTKGQIWDVNVDIREDSPNFKKWFGIELTEENFKQIFIPVGFAHGFSVLSDFAEIEYKVTSYYDPKLESGICWDDPSIGINWKITNPILSDRDKIMPLLDDFLKEYKNPFEE
jgi:dTDP-4-dehydrorhamnose 3,5-epimerase